MFDPLRVGRSLRAIRIRLGLRQAHVAGKAGVSRSFVSRLECGRAGATDLAEIEAVCRALGADLDVRVRWRGEGLDRLLDEGHATGVDGIVELLRAGDWVIEVEVTFNDYGDRGSIDVFAWHLASGSLLVVEVKSVVPDAQGTLMPLDRKARVAPKLATCPWLAAAHGEPPPGPARGTVQQAAGRPVRRVVRCRAAASKPRGSTVASHPGWAPRRAAFPLKRSRGGHSTNHHRPHARPTPQGGLNSSQMISATKRMRELPWR